MLDKTGHKLNLIYADGESGLSHETVDTCCREHNIELLQTRTQAYHMTGWYYHSKLCCTKD